MDDFELVSFISIEGGDDLILSFYIVESDDPTDGRSLILRRSPKWEVLFPEQEWGVQVSDEGWSYDDEEKWQDNFFEWILLGHSTAEIRCRYLNLVRYTSVPFRVIIARLFRSEGTG